MGRRKRERREVAVPPQLGAPEGGGDSEESQVGNARDRRVGTRRSEDRARDARDTLARSRRSPEATESFKKGVWGPTPAFAGTRC